MESIEPLAYLVFFVGWPILIIGSIWLWRNIGHVEHAARIYLNIAVAAFYLLGFVCTMYWLGQPWYVGVFPAFAIFLVLFAITLRTAYVEEHRPHGDLQAHA